MAYNGRKGPNVSEYIANLNAIPSAQDLQNAESFNLDDDLAMFTNTQFFDFDLGQDADLQPGDFNGRAGEQTTVAPDNMELKPMDFSLQGMFRCYIMSLLCFIYWAIRPFFTLKLPSASLSLLCFDTSSRPRCRISLDAWRILDNQSQSLPPNQVVQ